MLRIKVKYFNELNIDELYDLLQLRSEVFVVEQECAYQDIDGKDQKALHVLGYKEEELIAYTRIFEPGYYFNEAAIGRVVVTKKERDQDLGYVIMNASIQAVQEYYNTSKIKLSAQTYLKQFYNNLGFKEVGEEYLEDGILHIEMLKE
jgi:ElaA protein